MAAVNQMMYNVILETEIKCELTSLDQSIATEIEDTLTAIIF